MALLGDCTVKLQDKGLLPLMGYDSIIISTPLASPFRQFSGGNAWRQPKFSIER